MKSKVVPHRAEGTLPDHAVHMENWPEGRPRITEQEISDFLNAREYFQIARANYERRRGELLYKLQLECQMEDCEPTAPYVVRLESDGDTICILDQGSTPNETILDRR